MAAFQVITEAASLQPQSQNVQAQPNPQNTSAQTGHTQAASPQPQAKPAPPADFHQSLFKSILETISGGSRYVARTDEQGNQVLTRVPQTKKSLAGGILAGALSSMVAGMAAPDSFDEYGHRTFGPSAAAGAQVGQNMAAKKGTQGAKALDDEETNRRFAVLDHNLKLHSAVMNNQKLQGEIMDKGLSEAQPLTNAMQAAAQSNPKLIKQQGVTEEQLHKMMQDGTAHVTLDSVIPDGKVEVIGRDGKGTGKYAYTYTVYDPNALVNVTDELKKTDPRFAAIPKGQFVPARVFAKTFRNKIEANAAQEFMDRWIDQTNEAFPKAKLDKVQLDLQITRDPYLLQLMPILGKYADEDPATAAQSMRKDGVDPNVVGRFSQLLKIDQDAWANYKESEKKKADLASNPDKQPADPDTIAKLPQRIKALGLTDAQADEVLSELPKQGATRADVAKVLEMQEINRTAISTNKFQVIRKPKPQSGVAINLIRRNWKRLANQSMMPLLVCRDCGTRLTRTVRKRTPWLLQNC